MGGVHRRVGVGGVWLHWVGVQGFRVHETWWAVVDSFRAHWITQWAVWGVQIFVSLTGHAIDVIHTWTAVGAAWGFVRGSGLFGVRRTL
jgi:hypothetical protein